MLTVCFFAPEKVGVISSCPQKFQIWTFCLVGEADQGADGGAEEVSWRPFTHTFS